MFGLTTKAKARAVAHAVKEATGDPGFAVQIIDRKSLARDPGAPDLRPAPPGPFAIGEIVRCPRCTHRLGAARHPGQVVWDTKCPSCKALVTIRLEGVCLYVELVAR